MIHNDANGIHSAECGHCRFRLGPFDQIADLRPQLLGHIYQHFSDEPKLWICDFTHSVVWPGSSISSCLAFSALWRPKRRKLKKTLRTLSGHFSQ